MTVEIKEIRDAPQSFSFSCKLHIHFQSVQEDNTPTSVVETKEMTLVVVILG